MKKYFDIELGIIVTEDELYIEWLSLKESDSETYTYSFSKYLENCTSKNGSLLRVLDTHKGEIF